VRKIVLITLAVWWFLLAMAQIGNEEYAESLAYVALGLLFIRFARKSKSKSVDSEGPAKVTEARTNRDKQPKSLSFLQDNFASLIRSAKKKFASVEAAAAKAKDSFAAAAKNPSAKKPVATARNSAKHQLISDVAEQLRLIATKYEDPEVEFFFNIGNIGVRRATKSTDVYGPCVLNVGRNGVYLQYRNQNSRTGKVNELKKPWTQVIGTPQFPSKELYFKDHSFVEFLKSDDKEFIILSIFWQVFQQSLNGQFDEMKNWSSTHHGDRLIEISNWIQENPNAVTVNPEFNIELVPVGVGVEPTYEEIPDFKFPKAGDEIKGWILQKSLGGGGFGEVYLASKKGSKDELAAVKLMKLDKGVKPGSTRFHKITNQFMDEAKLSQNFQSSPYVITAKAFGVEPWPWIRYPFAKGNTVRTITQHMAFNDEQWWNLAHDLLAALYEIHAEGIIHRDIKFDNIMVMNDRAALLDFGISHVAGYEFKKNAAAAIAFTSPEMLKLLMTDGDIKKITPATDIFGAGLILYTAKTQKQPWPVFSSGEEHLNDMLSKPLDYSAFSREQGAMLRKMLAIEAADRPSAKKLLELVAPHIDVGSKIKMIEEFELQKDIDLGLPKSHGQEISDGYVVNGPFKSWGKFEEILSNLIENVKPRYFVVQINFSGNREMVYFQAMSEGGGWVMECMSEIFSDKKHSTQQKANFMQLGWDAPTKYSPNYQAQIDGYNPKEMAKHFIAAYETGYQYKLADIANFEVTIQGSNNY
jgi:serine/threonine protein kinase